MSGRVIAYADVAGQAAAFHESPEYGKARDARAGAAVMRMIAVEGL